MLSQRWVGKFQSLHTVQPWHHVILLSLDHSKNIRNTPKLPLYPKYIIAEEIKDPRHRWDHSMWVLQGNTLRKGVNFIIVLYAACGCWLHHCWEHGCTTEAVPPVTNKLVRYSFFPLQKDDRLSTDRVNIPGVINGIAGSNSILQDLKPVTLTVKPIAGLTLLTSLCFMIFTCNVSRVYKSSTWSLGVDF